MRLYHWILVMLMTCPTLALGQGSAGTATSSRYRHPPQYQLHVNTDKFLSLGATASAPSFWMESDSAANPDQFVLQSTDCDGAGADCIIFAARVGSAHVWHPIATRLILDGSGIGTGDDYITCTANDNCRWVIGGQALMSGTSTAFFIGLASGTITFPGDTVIDGNRRCSGQAFTCADSGGAGAAACTLQPTSCYVQITCNDADGCNITMSETNIAVGDECKIVNISANVCNFADTAGVTEISGAYAAGQWDTITLQYASDRWVEYGRSNN